MSNERSRVWSPLARNFADLGRDLFAAARVAEVLEHVVGVATTVMAGANGAGASRELGRQSARSSSRQVVKEMFRS